MILHEIELLNFRQFYGKQILKFAEGEKNITIFFGDNGKGKTGIFRALMFGLYGSAYIQQDNKNDVIHLVNLLALQENERQPVEAYVKIKLSDKGKNYEIRRCLKGVKNASDIVEREDGIELYSTDERGNFSPQPITDKQKVEIEINKVLNEEIKDFFLFDAEKIDTLAKTDSKVKQEVKTAIFKLLQIENIEKSSDVLQRLYSKQNKKIVEESKNLDIEKKSKEIDDIDSNLSSKTIIQDKKEENLRLCNEEILDMEEKLSKNEDIKNLQFYLKKEEEILSSYEGRLSDKKREVKNMLVQNAPKLLLRDNFSIANNYLTQSTSKQESVVPIEVLDLSLQNNVCACCNNDLSAHLNNLNHVKSLKENYKRSIQGTFTSALKNVISAAESEYDSSKEDIYELLKELREIRIKRDETKASVSDINDKLGEKARSQQDMANYEMTIKKNKEIAQNLQTEIFELKKEIKEDESRKVVYQKELERMMRDNDSLRFDSKVLSFINELKQDLGIISEEFSVQMREKLKDQTTEIFKMLIDHKDRDLVKRIEINDKFEISIIGWDNTEITQDISQGQRQIVALSFITALAKIAGGEERKVSFPLFMDAPFGRISGNNRDHLISNLPDLTSQWILLLTDTELTYQEEKVFKTTEKLGKWYRLDQIQLYHSEIVEIEINQTMATRG
ncbi:AAA family ATPase [Sporosarcina sp. F6_3S_P_2]|uniref:Nuclease SbcCD subunit C n=2 Tax=Sporosarcina highlanderae TaxID=3035916 RepID=A0ABT8JP88_9BACL|nr:AAA family ATPase [Sporosarcina highlanderae]